MNRKLNSNSGFTLIELMITVVIIGLVSAMAVPRFARAYERMTFRSANREISSTIRLARSMAISNKDVFGVHFNNESKVISLFKKDDTSTLLDTYESTDSLIRADTVYGIFDMITTDLANNAISFRPNGSAVFTGGGNIVTLTSNEDLIGINQFNILASTGRVHSEGYYY